MFGQDHLGDSGSVCFLSRLCRFSEHLCQPVGRGSERAPSISQHLVSSLPDLGLPFFLQEKKKLGPRTPEVSRRSAVRPALPSPQALGPRAGLPETRGVRTARAPDASAGAQRSAGLGAGTGPHLRRNWGRTWCKHLARNFYSDLAVI